CLSSVVIPGALPESTWFCFTQLRRVFLLIPTCSPTSRHAVLTASAGSLVSFSLTMRTARSRTSAGYLLGAGMFLSSRLDQALHHTRGDPNTIACPVSSLVGSSGVCSLRLARKREEIASSCRTWPKA